jgi:catechol 2,3-dioxygenase
MSHVILDVTDLPASRQFYERLLGLVVTVADTDVVYLRGVEEACHHSLVLSQAAAATCRRVGLRVRAAEDLDRAQLHFKERGLATEWIEVPYQDRTLRASDDSGVPLELCAGMPTQPRLALRFEQFAGAAAKGLDHVQVRVPDVAKTASFYAGLGFRITGYASLGGSPDGPFRSIFMSRKGNANDLVLLQNAGPSLHHLAYVVSDPSLTLSRVVRPRRRHGSARCDRVGTRAPRARLRAVPLCPRSRRSPHRAARPSLPVHRPRGAARGVVDRGSRRAQHLGARSTVILV